MYSKDTEPLYNSPYVLTCITSFQYLSIPNLFIACYNYMVRDIDKLTTNMFGWANDDREKDVVPLFLQLKYLATFETLLDLQTVT